MSWKAARKYDSFKEDSYKHILKFPPEQRQIAVEDIGEAVGLLRQGKAAVHQYPGRAGPGSGPAFHRPHTDIRKRSPLPIRPKAFINGVRHGLRPSLSLHRQEGRPPQGSRGGKDC